MKLKGIRIRLLAIVIILLLLVIGITPVAANGENGNGAPPFGGRGPSSSAYAGQFLVLLCGSYGGYNWVEEWQHGKTLAEPVSQVEVCYSYGTTRPPYHETTFKIEIPEGTVIEGYYPGAGRVNFLEVKCVEGQLYFSPNLKLSQPATLYKLVDGEWVEVLSFTQVLNGKAS